MSYPISHSTGYHIRLFVIFRICKYKYQIYDDFMITPFEQELKSEDFFCIESTDLFQFPKHLLEMKKMQNAFK